MFSKNPLLITSFCLCLTACRENGTTIAAQTENELDSTVVVTQLESTEEKPAQTCRLISLLAMPEDSISHILSGSDETRVVNKVKRHIGKYLRKDGSCDSLAVVILDTSLGMEQTSELFITTCDSTQADWSWSSFEFSKALGVETEVVNRYQLFETCNVLQVVEHVYFGESEGWKTVMHFFEIDDFNSPSEILAITAYSLQEAGEGDSTNLAKISTEEIEFVPGWTDGFRNLKVIVKDQTSAANLGVKEQSYRFNKVKRVYEEAID